MSPQPLSPEQTVQFRPGLSIVEDRPGQYCLGDPQSGEFVAVPTPGVFIVRAFQDGHSVEQVSHSFEAEYGEPPDLAAFIAELAGIGLVERVGSELQPAPAQRARGVRLLAGLQQRHCRWLLSRPVTIFSVAAWAILPVLLLRHVPTAADALVFPSVLVLLLLFVPIAWALLCLHELSHSLVARALGCPAYTRFGNRLWNLVCETDLSSIYSLPSRRRLRPLLAGMTLDVAILDVSLLLMTSEPGWRAPRVVAYMLFSNLIYQCCVFMRTDLYYVATTITGLDNLIPDARAELLFLVRQVLHRPSSPPRRSRTHRAMVRGYLVGCLAALGIGAATVANLIIPASVGVVRLAIAAIERGPSDPEFWAASFTVVFFAFVYSVLGWTFARNRRDRARSRRRASL